MTKRLMITLIVAVLAALLLTSFVFARASFDTKRVVNDRAAKIQELTFAHPDRPAIMVSDRNDGAMGPQPAPAPRKVSVGVAGVNQPLASPGIGVDLTYDDWQGSPRGRKVDFWGQPHMQFAYSDQQSTDNTLSRTGYNVYDPVGGNWPQGIDQGCEVQAAGDAGYATTMAVTPKGRVVLAGADGGGNAAENHFYYQSVNTAFSCTWGAGTMIPKSSYSTWRGVLGDSLGDLVLPVIDIQIIGSDTITHVAARFDLNVARATGNPGGLTNRPHLYYRKLGQTNSGTWQGPTILDTVFNQITLASSRISPKVAVSYAKTTDNGFLNSQANDEAMYYRESVDGGLTWGPATAIHPTNRTVPSIAPWVESQCYYDSNGNLHVVFNAIVIPANPYGGGFTWNSLYNGSNMYHWYKPTNTVSLVYDATWDPALLPGDLCGWIGTNALTTTNMSISECAGRMYVFWSMANDMNTPGQPHDDCTSGGPPDDWRFYANADLFVSVSNDMSGLLWDAPRNITNTYTPGCDSATGGGVCMNDVKLAVSRYGFDSSSFGQALIWPEPALNLGGGGTNDSTLQLFYVEDHYPGQAGLNAAGRSIVCKHTLNPLRWARLQCIAPISAPRIKVTPNALGYPMFVNYNATTTHPITVANQGNDVLSVNSVEVVKASYIPENWLTVSSTSFTVPAASSSTFDINIHATPAFSPGTIYALNGLVKVHSNVPTADSVKIITIENYLAADTVVGLVWDTVGSSCTRLIVSSNGDMGNMGFGGYNLDFVGTKTDCDTVVANSVYLYSGGPMVIKKTGASSYVFSSMLHQGDFTTTQAMKNIEGASPSSVGNADYDRFFTGNMVNRDTTIVLNRTYYAPKSGDCNFIVVQSKYWAKTAPVAGVSISEIIDWDVPGLNGSDNKSGVSAKGFVYQRGTDTVATCPDSSRFAAQALLGYFTKSELTTNCINHDSPYGMYAELNDSVFRYDTAAENVEAGYFWTKDTVGGFRALAGVTDDQHSVLTILRDATISNTDTLVVFTVVSSVMQGTLTDLETHIAAAKTWYGQKLRSPACNFGSCCKGSVGNADNSPDDVVDVGDLTALIDILFINFPPMACAAECNCDGSGDGVVDVGDLTALIDNLFINFTALPACP